MSLSDKGKKFLVGLSLVFGTAAVGGGGYAIGHHEGRESVMQEARAMMSSEAKDPISDESLIEAWEDSSARMCYPVVKDKQFCEDAEVLEVAHVVNVLGKVVDTLDKLF